MIASGMAMLGMTTSMQKTGFAHAHFQCLSPEAMLTANQVHTSKSTSDHHQPVRW
jgi:hypothetical protein